MNLLVKNPGKIAVLNCSGWENYRLLSSLLDSFLSYYGQGEFELLSFMSEPNIQLERFSRERGLPLSYLELDQTRLGYNAPYSANLELIQKAEIVVVFWDMQDFPIKHMVETCRHHGKPLCVFVVPNSEHLALL